jgi:hypothetical protein
MKPTTRLLAPALSPAAPVRAGAADAVRPTKSSPRPPLEVTLPHEKPQEHERRHGRRRLRTAQKLAQLRAQVDAWGRVALALPLVDDADEIWDAFLDVELKSVREQLRRLALAAHKKKTLHAENALLQSLLAEHRLASQAIHRLGVAAREVELSNNWELQVQRWRALARIHFRPWTHEQCAAEIAAVERELDRIEAGDQDRDSGLTVMGWTDRVGRRPHEWADASPHLHFSLHKTFRAFDLAHFVESVERIFKDTALYTQIVHGGRARAAVDVLQQLSPRVAVVMYHETFPGLVDATVHLLSLNVRTQRADGTVTQFYRPIDSPEVMRAFVKGPHDTWMCNFHWARYHVLRRTQSSCDYRLTVHGTIQGEDLSLMRYWRFRVLESLIRIEGQAARRPLLEVS